MTIEVNDKTYAINRKDLIKIPVEYASAVTGYLIIKTAVDICTQMQANSLAKATLKVGGRILAATFGVGAGAMAGELVDILLKEKKEPAMEDPTSCEEDDVNG